MTTCLTLYGVGAVLCFVLYVVALKRVCTITGDCCFYMCVAGLLALIIGFGITVSKYDKREWEQYKEEKHCRMYAHVANHPGQWTWTCDGTNELIVR